MQITLTNTWLMGCSTAHPQPSCKAVTAVRLCPPSFPASPMYSSALMRAMLCVVWPTVLPLPPRGPVRRCYLTAAMHAGMRYCRLQGKAPPSYHCSGLAVLILAVVLG